MCAQVRTPVILINGMTASCKTKIAQRLAKIINGEIICGDSNQVKICQAKYLLAKK